MKVSRRAFLSGTGVAGIAGLAGCTDLSERGSEPDPQSERTANTTPGGCPIRGDAVYVWGPAGSIVGDDQRTEQFLDDLDCMGVSRAFVSWGAVLDSASATNAQLSSFASRCADAGIDVSLLWGLELGSDGIERARATLEDIDSIGIDSVHYDIEPDPDEALSLSAFLDSYAGFLDTVQSKPLDVSVFVAPYWFDVAPEQARRVRDHDAVDWTVVAAYRTTEDACRQQLQLALGDTPRHPYYAAFEFQRSDLSFVDESITFWDEGSDHAMDVLQGIASDPPAADQFEGVALHTYDAVSDSHYR